ncbi:MAG TPA: hypothetical protein VIQ51_14550 [Chryseosolibacter sp.]|jgi:hypothetical protein
MFGITSNTNKRLVIIDNNTFVPLKSPHHMSMRYAVDRIIDRIVASSTIDKEKITG